MFQRGIVRCAAAPAAADSLSLTARIQRIQGEASFLRRAPPALYVTIDSPVADKEVQHTRRHRTHVIDAFPHVTPASGTTLPLTCAVFALRSSAAEESSCSDASASSTLLVDVPNLTDPDTWLTFLRQHDVSLGGLHTVALTELQPHTTLAVKQLIAVRPDVQICCSPFLSAVLTDTTFFANVKRAVLERAGHTPEAVQALHEQMQFAGLSGDQVRVVAHGEAIVVDRKAEKGAIARSIEAHHVSAAAAAATRRPSSRARSARSSPPSFFNHTPVLYFDRVLASVHTGSTIVRIPWLPHIMPEVSRDAALPHPPLLARRGARASSGEARDGPLLHTWRVEADTAELVAALRGMPTAQHVLSSSYGALEGDVEDVCASITKHAHGLEQLRSRLSRRLEADTLRDPQSWSGPLLKKIVTELLCTQSAHPATEPEVLAQALEWSESSQSPLADVAEALAYAAVTLPPSRDENAPATSTRGTLPTHAPAPHSSSPTASPVSHVSEPSSDLEGAKGVEVLQAIFTKKGLHGLGKTAAREEVDVKVFLSMNASDFRRVFKTTFGVSKKLEMLQEEIRKNMP